MTLAEALQSAADRLDAATQTMTAIRDQVAGQLAASTSTITTIINTFVARPPVTTVFVDPINGSEANDGASINTPRKSLDAVIRGMGVNSTEVHLLKDATSRSTSASPNGRLWYEMPYAARPLPSPSGSGAYDGHAAPQTAPSRA